MTCLTNEGFQPFPKIGKLAVNTNLSHTDLLNQLSGHDTALGYSYVMTSLEINDSNLVQKGSGPNFQGGLITLCTCKRRLRTSPDIKPGIWVAGFSQNLDSKGNALFYLMKVSTTFCSQYELWNHLKPEVRETKSATLHRLGDVFEPKTDPIHPDKLHSPESYKKPHKYHSHAWDSRLQIPTNDWYKDINYQGFGRRYHTLLIGDPGLSFLWLKPTLYYAPAPHPRTKKWDTLKEFLNHLIG